MFSKPIVAICGTALLFVPAFEAAAQSESPPASDMHPTLARAFAQMERVRSATSDDARREAIKGAIADADAQQRQGAERINVAYKLYADAAMQYDEPDLAKLAATRVIDLDADSFSTGMALELRARVAARMGDRDAERTDLSRCQSLLRDAAQRGRPVLELRQRVLARLAEFAIAKNDKEEARGRANEILDISRQAPPSARSFDNRVFAIRVLVLVGDAAAANAELERLLSEKFPDDWSPGSAIEMASSRGPLPLVRRLEILPQLYDRLAGIGSAYGVLAGNELARDLTSAGRAHDAVAMYKKVFELCALHGPRWMSMTNSVEVSWPTLREIQWTSGVQVAELGSAVGEKSWAVQMVAKLAMTAATDQERASVADLQKRVLQ